MRCPACGFSAEEERFHSGCPSCGYSARQGSGKVEPVYRDAKFPFWFYLLAAAIATGILAIFVFTLI